MKSIKLSFALFIGLLCAQSNGFAQIAFSPFVDSISGLVSNQSAMRLLKELSGDTAVLVNGQLTTIFSRYYLSNYNATAAQFIYEKFQQYGYEPEFQNFNGTRGANVIATKLGTRYPDKQYIICGHYDNMPSGNIAPGADDNASGTVAVLEAARILSSINTDYTIIFAAWDEEEIGLVGSQYYAQQAFANGDQIMGVLNLDMIAWDSDNDNLYSISKNDNSNSFSEDFITTTGYYEPQLANNFITTTASDHSSFWNYGYPAILSIEDFYDFNDYYHTLNDNISNVNQPYFLSMVRAAVANIAANGLNQRITFEHQPVISSSSTGPREAVLEVSIDHPIATGAYAPRLYYTVDSIDFDFVLPSQISGNTYTFMIPGFALGTTVSYYFAVQDEDAMMIETHPSGGRGINPPGTINPPYFFSYMINNSVYAEDCSPNTPMAINDNANTYDQFYINHEGILLDLDVLIDISHPRDYELRLMLIGPTGTIIMLSDHNGGEGDNFTQTIFDDQAMISIKDGTAPFTGRYIPDASFNNLLQKPIKGTWKLRIVDSGYVNTSTLNQWCLHFLYKDSDIGSEYLEVPEEQELYQNYPNPVTSATCIKFRLSEQSYINLNVYNNQGQKVRTLASALFPAGDHLIITSLDGLKPGVYFYRLEGDKYTITKQLIKVN
ncbi:MAG TPA: M20/M25/M40 family metallo-hydrolase [Lentimicrobium sp.]|nr:M20/M25/M40 family metallo-hydrolase [Lentimicrobium sp.]